jgi:hypothetical protein
MKKQLVTQTSVKIKKVVYPAGTVLSQELVDGIGESLNQLLADKAIGEVPAPEKKEAPVAPPVVDKKEKDKK